MSFSALFLNNIWGATPELFRGITLSALLTYGAIVGTSTGLVSSTSQTLPILGAVMNRLTARSVRIAARLVINGSVNLSGTPATTRFNGIRLQDSAIEGAKRIILLATAGCRLGSSQHAIQLGRYAFEYPLRMGLATMGLMVMVSANDLIARYLGLEWQSLCLYVLAAFRRGSAYSTEAGLKYFIMGAVASGFLLFGSSLIYGATGTVNFGDLELRTLGALQQDIPFEPRLAIGMAMVISAFYFKLAVAPFHAWSPDVYEGSPTPSTLYFAVVPKMALLMARTRLLYGPFADLFAITQPMRLMGSVRSRGVAALSARVQTRLKRFRAYSAIGHIGYILLGLSSGSLEGVQGSRIYRVMYVVMSLNVWLAIMSISRVSTQVDAHGHPNERIQSAKYRTDLAGLGRMNPFLAATVSLSVRSMAGIPPLAGFMAKMWVFFSAISQSLVLFSVFAVLSSCVGAFYYRRWIKVMYFEGAPQWTQRVQVDRMTSRVMGTTMGRRMTMLAFPGPIRLMTHRMALAVCRG